MAKREYTVENFLDIVGAFTNVTPVAKAISLGFPKFRAFEINDDFEKYEILLVLKPCYNRHFSVPGYGMGIKVVEYTDNVAIAVIILW